MDFPWRYEKRGLGLGPKKQRRRSASEERPYSQLGSFLEELDVLRSSFPEDVCALRIVFLGKNVSENSRVRNLILGIDIRENEEPTALEQHNVIPVSGIVKDRHITVINTLHLLNPNISHHQITQTVRECVYLSDPGPHAFILVLQNNDFTEEDMRSVKYVLKQFSEEAIKHTLVLMTDTHTSLREKHAAIHELLKECGGRHLQLDERNPEWLSEIFKSVDKILEENKEEYLTCELFHDVKESLEDEEQSRSVHSFRSDEEYEEPSECTGDKKPKERQKERIKAVIRDHSPEGVRPNFSNKIPVPDYDLPEGGASDPSKQNLRLVLCGSDEKLRKDTSKQIRDQIRWFPSIHQKIKDKECVKKEGMVSARPISLLELPAVNHLSEEEVMRQCVSLCDPGVHVFLLIIPAGPLTDEDKAEIENIKKRFSSRINQHVMVLVIPEKHMTSQMNVVSPSTETFIQTLGGRRFVFENSSQVPALLEDVENIVKQNNGSCYTTLMYLQAQIELEKNKHKFEIEELKRSMLPAGVIHDDLRIVLLGKTGVGKSATGNTILGKKAFNSFMTSSSLTKECQKETAEFNRRRITVIDTPGLFDTAVDNVETRKEIVKCISMAAPGPHVFLLVIQLGRFTKEEKDTVKMIQETFGDKSRMYTMVLFTRGDDLRGTTIQAFIEADDSLKNIVQQFGHRYHVFNNNKTKDRKQVSGLLDKIDCLVVANGGSFYTNEMFQNMEKNIKEEQERILKEKEEEIKRKEEELTEKYEAEIELIKKENERERETMENELRKREEEFKKKEEEIKKETDENLQKELQRKLEEQQKQFEEENKRIEKALGEQQQNIKYLEEKHEKEKLNMQEKIQHETREQAEREFREKLNREVARALEEAEEKLPYTAKLARDWSQSGGVLGSFEYFMLWIISAGLKHQAQNKTDE